MITGCKLVTDAIGIGYWRWIGVAILCLRLDCAALGFCLSSGGITEFPYWVARNTGRPNAGLEGCLSTSAGKSRLDTAAGLSGRCLLPDPPEAEKVYEPSWLVFTDWMNEPRWLVYLAYFFFRGFFFGGGGILALGPETSGYFLARDARSS